MLLMEKHKLNAVIRKITGRKAKKLRSDGWILANIFGKDIKSLALQIKTAEFLKTLDKAGETGIIELAIESEEKTRPVLISHLQKHPVTRQILHADLHQVNLKEKIKAMVPIVLEGEAKAVSDKIGILLQTLSEVEVEALPTDLPEHLTINVEKLVAIGEQITVADIKPPTEVIILTDAHQVIVKIDELISKEAEEQAKAEAAAAEAAAAETATAEGTTPAEPSAEATIEPTEPKPAEENETK